MDQRFNRHIVGTGQLRLDRDCFGRCRRFRRRESDVESVSVLIDVQCQEPETPLFAGKQSDAAEAG